MRERYIRLFIIYFKIIIEPMYRGSEINILRVINLLAMGRGNNNIFVFVGKFNNRSSLTDPPVRVCYGTRQRRHDSVGLIGRQVRFPLLLFLPPSPFVSLLCPPTQHSERPARA